MSPFADTDEYEKLLEEELNNQLRENEDIWLLGGKSEVFSKEKDEAQIDLILLDLHYWVYGKIQLNHSFTMLKMESLAFIHIISVLDIHTSTQISLHAKLSM